MKKNVYSIYDKQVKAYMNPLVCTNDAEAIRLFTTFVNEDNKQSNICMYPEHFSMWRLGTMDAESGNLEKDQKELITGNACKNEQKQYTITDIMNLIKEQGA